MNEIEKYIVERLRLLENVVNKQEDEISALKEELEKVEKMKTLMREYFILKPYADGSPYIARCGNAVPPPFAEALVRANLPEMCGAKIHTMRELREVI